MKRQRHIASYQNVYCPTAEDLYGYRTRRLDPEMRNRIFHHLKDCIRCRLLYRDLPSGKIRQNELWKPLMNKGQRLPGPFQTWALPATPLRLSAGQIWTTMAIPRDPAGREVITVPLAGPVLISWPGSGEKGLHNLIRVIPTSLDTDFAVNGEDVVLQEKSPLGYDILLEVWNESPMLAGNLGEFRGQVSDADLIIIQRIREGLLSGKKKHQRYDAELKRWRRLEMERTTYLSAPVNASFAEDEESSTESDEKERRKPIRSPDETTPASPLFRKEDRQPWAIIPVTVDLYYYQMAAETEGIEIDELHPTDLPMKTDLLSASLLQKRNEIWLRLKMQDKKPVAVFVAGDKRELVAEKKGYPPECLLGNVHALPDQLEVKIVHRGEEHVFVIRPRKKAQ